MSWLKNIVKSATNVTKKIGGAIGGAAKSVAPALKKAIVPLASLAAGLVPGVGPFLSAGVDILGNKLLNGSAEVASETAASPVEAVMMSVDAAALSLGSSPAAMALTAATTQSKGVFGIGDGQPGLFGIGDGKPGVFGIGTGVGKAKKEAADVAREQAEAAAKGEGLSPKLVKLAGETAAVKAEQKVVDNQNKPAGSGGALPWLIGAGLLLLGL
jgi:hypothetical protein